MSTSFAFVPRIVAKHSKPWNGISRRSPSPSSSSASDDQDSTADSDSCDHTKGKEKEKALEPAQSKQSTISQDVAALVSLALSDYNIWLDPDLRWKLDACLINDIPPGEAGFVPINYLLRRAPFRGSLPLSSGQPEPSETEVVKALRAHVSHVLEVRMRLPSFSASPSAPSSSVWYGTGKTSRKKDVGGYEVRRRDWQTLSNRASRGWTRARWDDMTAYIEGIPPQYRTVGGIARFTETLLWSSSDSEPRIHIQNITLPPHYLDKPGDTPKCKGYALVTFSTKSYLEAVLRVCPWKRRRLLVPDGDEETNIPPAVKEAQKYGLRAISKARWDKLNEEYLIYKQHLVNEMALTQSEICYPEESVINLTFEGDETQTQKQRQTTTMSPYPFDCLVFVRNVHPETNKTTLKSFFGQALQDNPDGDQDRGRASAGLDYVDFTKGMDSCHLRLASPQQARRLVAYFGAQRISQADGLDAVGRDPVPGDKSIAMELILGRREELYWEQVPEKVRHQAVDKAVEAQRASVVVGESSMSLMTVSTTRCDDACGGRRRKRARES